MKGTGFLKHVQKITSIKSFFSLFAEIAALPRMDLPGELRAQHRNNMKAQIKKIERGEYTGGTIKVVFRAI